MIYDIVIYTILQNKRQWGGGILPTIFVELFKTKLQCLLFPAPRYTESRITRGMMLLWDSLYHDIPSKILLKEYSYQAWEKISWNWEQMSLIYFSNLDWQIFCCTW